MKFNIIIITLTLAFIGGLSWADYKEYGLKKVSQPKEEETKTRNLAIWHFGASLIKVKPTGGFEVFTYSEESDDLEYSLLSGDPSYSYTLMSGKQYYVIDLGNTFIAESFGMKNFTARGTVRVAGSTVFYKPESKKWKWIDETVTFDREAEIHIPLGFLKARYLLVEFDIEDPGNVSNLSIIGPTKARAPDKQFTIDQLPKDVPIVPFNFAQTNEGATIEYVSSGDEAKVNKILDDSFEEPYEFEENDNQAVMILDLNKVRSVNGLNMLMQSDPGTFTFIFLDDLPEELKEEKEKEAEASTEEVKEFGFLNLSNALPSRLLVANEGTLGEALTLGDIKGMKENVGILKAVPADAVALQKVLSPGEEQMQFDFANVNTRYVVMVWTRNEEYVAQSGITPGPLKIYQVNVIGDVPQTELLINPVVAFVFDQGDGESGLTLLSTGDPAFGDLGSGGETVNDNPPTVPPIVPNDLPVISPGATVSTP